MSLASGISTEMVLRFNSSKPLKEGTPSRSKEGPEDADRSLGLKVRWRLADHRLRASHM